MGLHQYVSLQNGVGVTIVLVIDLVIDLTINLVIDLVIDLLIDLVIDLLIDLVIDFVIAYPVNSKLKHSYLIYFGAVLIGKKDTTEPIREHAAQYFTIDFYETWLATAKHWYHQGQTEVDESRRLAELSGPNCSSRHTNVSLKLLLP